MKVNVPVVWNSNTYYSRETARLLAGFVDVYLLDFKYEPADCAISAKSVWKAKSEATRLLQNLAETAFKCTTS